MVNGGGARTAVPKITMLVGGFFAGRKTNGWRGGQFAALPLWNLAQFPHLGEWGGRQGGRCSWRRETRREMERAGERNWAGPSRGRVHSGPTVEMFSSGSPSGSMPPTRFWDDGVVDPRQVAASVLAEPLPPRYETRRSGRHTPLWACSGCDSSARVGRAGPCVFLERCSHEAGPCADLIDPLYGGRDLQVRRTARRLSSELIGPGAAAGRKRATPDRPRPKMRRARRRPRWALRHRAGFRGCCRSLSCGRRTCAPVRFCEQNRGDGADGGERTTT